MSNVADRRSSVASSEARYVRQLLITVGLLLAVGLLVAGIWLSIQVWLAVFAGILLAIFLRTLSLWLSKATRLPRIWSLVIVLLALLGLKALAGWLVRPKAAFN